MPEDNNAALFTPTTAGSLSLKNRIVYPAMTRARFVDSIANDAVVKYYTARASAGMIVTEPSAVSAEACGYNDAPKMYSESDVHSWGKVTSALHEANCTVVCQLWHTGRMSHSSFHSEAQIMAPSALKVVNEVNGVPACGVQGADGNWHEHEEPKAMSTADIEATVAAFGKAAELAKAAGFDGVELHAASGYLIDTFLQSCSNTRTDKYGGDAYARFTFLSEILGAVSKSFPLSQVGVKISPNNAFNGMGSPDNSETFLQVARRLEAMGIAYLHVVDGIGQHTNAKGWFGRVDSHGYHGHGTPLTLASLRSVYTGAIVGNGGYSADSAAAAIEAGNADAISFGRVFMSNPDLVERFRSGLPLTPLPPKDAWFVPTNATRSDLSAGYTEYGPYKKKLSPSGDSTEETDSAEEMDVEPKATEA